MTNDKQASTRLKLFFALCALPSIVANAYVVTILWRWFAVPLGLRPVGWSTVIGFGLIAGTVRSNMVAVVERPAVVWMRDHYLRATWYVLLGPPVILGLGRVWLWLGSL